MWCEETADGLILCTPATFSAEQRHGRLDIGDVADGRYALVKRTLIDEGDVLTFAPKAAVATSRTHQSHRGRVDGRTKTQIEKRSCCLMPKRLVFPDKAKQLAADRVEHDTAMALRGLNPHKVQKDPELNRWVGAQAIADVVRPGDALRGAQFRRWLHPNHHLLIAREKKGKLLCINAAILVGWWDGNAHWVPNVTSWLRHGGAGAGLRASSWPKKRRQWCLTRRPHLLLHKGHQFQLAKKHRILEEIAEATRRALRIASAMHGMGRGEEAAEMDCRSQPESALAPHNIHLVVAPGANLTPESTSTALPAPTVFRVKRRTMTPPCVLRTNRTRDFRADPTRSARNGTGSCSPG